MTVWLNEIGIDFLVLLQSLPIFTGSWEAFWLFCTKLGDPSWVFLVHAPLLYPFCRQTTIKFIIAGAISEFLNGVFKWMLFSDRPYWWIHIAGVYDELPPLKQFPLTCETGPGSPSGHAMVSASVWLIIVLNLKTKSRLLAYGKWIAYVVFLSLIAVSRLYIGTHFPHQVILGAFVGVVIGLIIQNAKLETFSFRFCVFLNLALLALAALTYFCILLAGRDPNWSIQRAFDWCQQMEWIHLSTTPLASLFRDVGALLGLGLVAEWTDLRKYVFQEFSLGKQILAAILGLVVGQFTFVCFPKVQSLLIFYCLTCFQYFVIVTTVLYGLPRVLRDISTDTTKISQY